MPAVSASNFGIGEAAHGCAHIVERFIEPAIAEGERSGAGHERYDTATDFRRVGGHELGRCRLVQECELARLKAKVGRPDEFGLAHRYATGNLIQVLTEGRLNQQMLEFAQTAAAVERGGMGGETAQRGRIGGQPSEPVSGMLVMLEQFRRRPARPA